MGEVRLHSFPRSQRQGILTSPPAIVLENMPAHIELRLLADIDPADYVDPTKIIYADLYVVTPRGRKVMCGNRPGGWRGGQYVDEKGNVNPAPTLISLTIADALRGMDFEFEVEIPVRMRVGFFVERFEG
jgi:hypothetical protein